MYVNVRRHIYLQGLMCNIRAKPLSTSPALLEQFTSNINKLVEVTSLNSMDLSAATPGWIRVDFNVTVSTHVVVIGDVPFKLIELQYVKNVFIFTADHRHLSRHRLQLGSSQI